jgi:hypothetical protein
VEEEELAFEVGVQQAPKTTVVIFKQLTGEYTIGVVSGVTTMGITVTHYTQIEIDGEDSAIWAFPIAVPLQGIDGDTVSNIETIIPKGSYLFFSRAPLDSAHPFVVKFKEFWEL